MGTICDTATSSGDGIKTETKSQLDSHSTQSRSEFEAQKSWLKIRGRTPRLAQGTFFRGRTAALQALSITNISDALTDRLHAARHGADCRRKRLSSTRL